MANLADLQFSIERQNTAAPLEDDLQEAEYCTMSGWDGGNFPHSIPYSSVHVWLEHKRHHSDALAAAVQCRHSTKAVSNPSPQNARRGGQEVGRGQGQDSRPALAKGTFLTL